MGKMGIGIYDTGMCVWVGGLGYARWAGLGRCDDVFLTLD